MRNDSRLEALARKAGAILDVQRCQPLRKPPRALDFDASSHQDSARLLLTQRRDESGFKDPGTGIRGKFRTHARKEALLKFSLNERRDAIDATIRRSGPVGLVQALVKLQGEEVLDTNIRHEQDGKKKSKIPQQDSVTKSDWLVQSVHSNSNQYVQLFASCDPRQNALDRAFEIALTSHQRSLAEILLRYGADPNSQPERFKSAIQSKDTALVTLFLQAPGSSSAQPLQSVHIEAGLLISVVNNAYDIAALLLAHDAARAAEPILTSIRSSDLRMLGVLLAAGRSKASIKSQHLNDAVSVACECPDVQRRTLMLDLLLCAGASSNAGILNAQLLSAVRRDDLTLIHLLIKHGKSVEDNEGEVIKLAVSLLRLECLEELLHGTVSQLVATSAIDSIPNHGTERDCLAAAELLFTKRASGGPWGSLLEHAVKQNYRTLTNRLAEHGASIEYKGSRAVCFVLRSGDISLLRTLLKGNSSEHSLAMALPDAMRLQEKEDRLQAFTLLLDKGVAGDNLDIALQTAVTEPVALQDVRLIDPLLRHKASVDWIDANGNCLHVAAKRGDYGVVALLCRSEITKDLVSKAVPLAFESRASHGYDNAKKIIALLLRNGACGTPVSETLVNVIREDDRADILRLLLSNGADVNHLVGLPVEEALRKDSITHLQVICSAGQINRASAARIVPIVLNQTNYDYSRACLLIASIAAAVENHTEILSQALLVEVEHSKGREDVVKALLKYGATANYSEGAALYHVVRLGDLHMCGVLTAVHLEHSSLSRAFRGAMILSNKPTQLAMMRLLLETVCQQKIGQDDALILATRDSVTNGIELVKLLIDHGADVNHDKGAALKAAVEIKDSAVLQLLLSRQAEAFALIAAFNVARQLPCAQGRISSTQERLPIFKLLLQAAKWATAGNELSEALVESVARDPHDLQIPQLLFDHGARIDHRTGEVLDVSTKIGNLPLLQLCVRMRPNSSSMERAFLSARRAKVTRSRRTELFASLLVRPPSNDQISAALEEAITRKNRDVDLLKLLLDHKASLNFNHAEGLCLLVQRGDLVTLDLLLRSQHANPTSLNRAFDLCIHLEKETRSEVATRLIPLGINAACLTGHLKKVVSGCHPGLLREMLVGGADPDRDGGECLKTAAGNGDLASLSLLMPFGIRQEYFNSAFENMLVLRTVEQGSEGLHCAELLLDHGIHQALKDRAILEAFEYSGTIRKAFVSILLKHGADSSTADCSCFVKAGSSNDLTLFDLLFQYERPPQLMISRLINESGNEQKVVDLIRRAFSHIESPIDVLNAEIMFMALRKFPRGSGELVKLLLDYGCPAGTTQTLKPKLKYEAEPLTPLVWCLHQPRPGISDAIVLKLLEKGEEAEPNYVTPTSQTTAIIEAAKTGRHNILKRLIELKVDVSFRNGKQRSPLFYASRNGDGNSVGALTKAGAQRDDGSLHEAARKVHANVVSLLLNDQHDPDYASENHKGRSALAELCVNATAGGRDWESQAYDIVKLLLPRTDLSEKYDGKMILHLALDNVRSALEMTTVLLRFSQIWKHLSDDDFLYEDDSNLCYSPTTYVEYFYEGSASGMRTQLIDLLKTKRCKDRYFSSKGKHPDRPLGLPADMASIFRRESLADQSHAETLRRCRETAMLELELSTMRHQQQFKLSTVQHRQQLEFSNEQHQTTLTQAGETEAQRLKSQQISHRMSLAQKRELEQEDRHALGERNRLLLQHNTATAAQEREIMSTRNANQISHEQRLLLMQQSHLDAQYSTKKKLLDAQDHVDEKHHSRNLRLMDRQDQSVAARARLAISVADANRLAAIAGSNHASLLRLTNGSDAGSVD